MRNINRFQGQGHRLGGNQNINQVRARQVQAANANLPQMPQQVAAQQVANQAQQVVPAIQALAQQNMQGINVNMPQQNVQQVIPQEQILENMQLQDILQQLPLEQLNAEIENFTNNIIRQYGQLPQEPVQPLRNEEMDNFVIPQGELLDISGLVTYLKDAVDNVKVISAQSFSLLPDQEGAIIIDGHTLRRQNLNEGIYFKLDKSNIYLNYDENIILYHHLSDSPFRFVEMDPLNNNQYKIANNNVKYIKTPHSSQLMVYHNQTPIIDVINRSNMKRFMQTDLDNNGWTNYVQVYQFDNQGQLTQHYIVSDRDNLKYDMVNNKLKTRDMEMDIQYNEYNEDNVLSVVVTEKIMNLFRNINQYVINYNGVNISIPYDKVNKSGTMENLISHHKEVLQALHRNGEGIIDDNREIIDLTADGDRIESIDGNWENGYIYYDEDNNKKYEYKKNINEQGENQITTYHEGLDVPSFKIITQSNLENLGRATYKYEMYDRRGENIFGNGNSEEIINNNVVDNIYLQVEERIDELAGDEEQEIRSLLLKVYNPEEVLRQIENIR